jgi:hypothetical protein
MSSNTGQEGLKLPDIFLCALKKMKFNENQVIPEEYMKFLPVIN